MVAHGHQYQHLEDEAADLTELDSKKEMIEKTKGGVGGGEKTAQNVLKSASGKTVHAYLWEFQLQIQLQTCFLQIHSNKLFYFFNFHNLSATQCHQLHKPHFSILYIKFMTI